MKKCFILLLLVLLTGCQGQTRPPKLDENPSNPIELTIGSTFTLRVRPEVKLFDSVYLTDLSSLNQYSVKTSVFDSVKTATLNIHTVNLFSSSADAALDYVADEKTLYSYYQQDFRRTKWYVESYIVTDFTPYLSKAFLSDMAKLQLNEIDPYDIFETYGTHVLLSVIEGYSIQHFIKIKSNELDVPQMTHLHDFLYSSQILNDPITDALYLDYASKSEIEYNLSTTFQSNSFLAALANHYNQPLMQDFLFTENDILPLYWIIDDQNPSYANAIQQLKAIYDLRFKTNSL
ncbi:hypothetical protein KTG15_12980 [Methanobacterium sp. YSL]|nr:hypothetical protein [Methanobacterium sp. YSL]